MFTTIADEWRAMSEQDQAEFLVSAVKRASRIARFRVSDASEFIGGVWLRLSESLTEDALRAINAERAASGKAEITLFELASRSAAAELMAAKRDTIKSADLVAEGADGESPLDLLTASEHNTERQAILRADMRAVLERFDSVNREILERRAAGFTEREISAVIRVSPVAVHKRICRIRETLAAALA